MTDDARDFLTQYTRLLDDAKMKVDEFLSSLEHSEGKMSMEDIIKQSRPLISKMSEEQEQYDKHLDLYLPCHAMIYLICRISKPDKIIETGIEKGGFTYMILSALEKNKQGHLWSIDIKEFWGFNGKTMARIGPLVSLNILKSRWTKIKGDAQRILPQVLKQTGSVEVFMALQGHTYEVQKHEGHASWNSIKNGGVFVLDRPDWNDGKYLQEFLDEHGDEVLYYDTFKEGRKSDPFEFTVILKK
ncbi:MAG: class I SAM-dependent methyltransferase [Candidatus Nitrosoabyssus spongiisocia]|nr:MAG: class I SAM-dependent methyltransferase [Nitrosopumilaceae archaeon AB1(1)]